MTAPARDHEQVPTGGLLAVHAHPDDETLSNGALLATWAAAGRPVTVVTCTRGEQGEVIPLDLRHLEGDGPALAEHRERELAAALDALGVVDHVFLDRVAGADGVEGTTDDGPRFVDSGMAWAAAGRATAADDVPAGAFVRVPLDDAAARLAAVIRRRRPVVVVGYEPGGGYGHPDHVRAHEVMHRAVELAGAGAGEQDSPWSVPVVLWTVIEEVRWRAALRRLREERLRVAPGDAPPSAVRAGPVDVRVPVVPVLDRLLAAFAAHRSQVQAVGSESGDDVVARYALSNDVLQPVLHDETYVVALGRPQDVDWPPGVTVVERG